MKKKESLVIAVFLALVALLFREAGYIGFAIILGVMAAYAAINFAWKSRR